MTSWIRAEYQCSRHIANIALDALQVYAVFGANLHALQDDPARIAEYCALLLDIADHGKYRGADIWRLFQQHQSERWYVTICHRACPVVAEYEEIPTLSLRLTVEEADMLQARLVAFVGAT
mgnify:CR=1 FL=1